jgi:hypothetical protein
MQMALHLAQQRHHMGAQRQKADARQKSQPHMCSYEHRRQKRQKTKQMHRQKLQQMHPLPIPSLV